MDILLRDTCVEFAHGNFGAKNIRCVSRLQEFMECATVRIHLDTIARLHLYCVMRALMFDFFTSSLQDVVEFLTSETQKCRDFCTHLEYGCLSCFSFCQQIEKMHSKLKPADHVFEELEPKLKQHDGFRDWMFFHTTLQRIFLMLKMTFVCRVIPRLLF